jgi:3',5'-nucleoside bisphosphate phosphatase
MLPTLVVASALARRLDLIAITDHNSAENVGAFIAAARQTPLKVIPGMEITTREEVHLLGLFPDPAAARLCQDEVYRQLPPLPNNEDAFGVQLVVDEYDELVRINERLLLTATAMSFEEAVSTVAALGGLAIPAHVNRSAFGVIAQLGFLPRGLAIAGIEASRHIQPRQVESLSPSLAGYSVLWSSDAHCLNDIGRVCTALVLAEPTFEELGRALSGTDGRQVIGRR